MQNKKYDAGGTLPLITEEKNLGLTLASSCSSSFSSEALASIFTSSYSSACLYIKKALLLPKLLKYNLSSKIRPKITLLSSGCKNIFSEFKNSNKALLILATAASKIFSKLRFSILSWRYIFSS